MTPTITQLLEAARRMYGTPCSLSHCKASGGIDGADRNIVLGMALAPTRDEAEEGTWVTARVWIPDSEVAS